MPQAFTLVPLNRGRARGSYKYIITAKMKKSKRKRHKGRKKIEGQQLPQNTSKAIPKSPKKGIFKRVMRVILFVVGVIGFFSSVYSFVPKVSIVPNSPNNPTNVFTSTFTVKNEGVLSVNDVKFSCANIRIWDDTGHQWMDWHGEMAWDFPAIDVMQSGETTTFMIPGLDESHRTDPFGFCDMTILVRYRPSLLFWEKKDAFRFTSGRNKDGSYFWNYRTKSEKVFAYPK